MYDSVDEIPERPHPNCKCNIDIIEKEDDTPPGIFPYGEVFERMTKKTDGLILKNDLLIQEIDDCMRINLKKSKK